MPIASRSNKQKRMGGGPEDPAPRSYMVSEGIPASMSNNLVYIWSDSKIITPENCRSVMRRRANVCGEYCQQQSLFLLRNPLTHNLASHMRSPPVLRRPISWEVEYSQLNYWLEYPPHTCGNGSRIKHFKLFGAPNNLMASIMDFSVVKY